MGAYRAAGELIERCDALLAQEDPGRPIEPPAVRSARRWTFPGQSLARQLTDYLRGTGELSANEHLVWRPDPSAL
jgi:hypothetical protein